MFDEKIGTKSRRKSIFFDVVFSVHLLFEETCSEAVQNDSGSLKVRKIQNTKYLTEIRGIRSHLRYDVGHVGWRY